MANIDIVAYNVAVFIVTLFFLEFGADKFIEHTSSVARRTGLPETIIALLTAGGEWEELAVVVASLARGRATLAIGNVLGSAISNILGAFSLGLLFHQRGASIEFDRSSRIYSLLSLALTTFVTPIVYFSTNKLWWTCGILLIILFAAYLFSVAWAIGKGSLTAPEDSDDDSSNDEGSTGDGLINDSGATGESTATLWTPSGTYGAIEHPQEQSLVEGSNLKRREQHGLPYDISYLVFGALAISLSGYILSHAAIAITDEFGASDMVFGIVILAIATTLPEKLIAVLSGYRGHTGVLVANTAGSNIFLLSLCLGIVMLDAPPSLGKIEVSIAELGMLWSSALAFTLTVWFGARYSWWIGIAMLVSYICFIAFEFRIIHH